MAKVDVSLVPVEERFPYASDTQNVLLWELKKHPKTVEQLTAITGLHKATIYTQIDKMLRKKWIKIFDKNGNTSVYCRVAFIEQSETYDRPLERNPDLYFFGNAISATLPEFIIEFGDPESNLRHSVETSAGLLSHMWLRSYYRRMGFHSKQIAPNGTICKKEFSKECDRMRKLSQLLDDILAAEFWDERPENEPVLLDTAPMFLRAFMKMAEIWRETYKPPKAKK